MSRKHHINESSKKVDVDDPMVLVVDDNPHDNDTPNEKSGAVGDYQGVTVNYVMAKGRSLCGTFKGIISEGQPIKPSDLRDGDAGFNGWKDAGFIVTDAEYKSQVEAKKK